MPKPWRKKYTRRRFTAPKKVKGKLAYNYIDSEVFLDVQPVTGKELLVVPEGNRQLARIKTFGETEFIVTEQGSQKKSDLLFYAGHWYECEYCKRHGNTPLAHYRSQFVMLAEAVEEQPPSEGGDT